VETQISEGESAMSYWDSKVFSRIYRRIQKFSQRHPKQDIDVLQQAKKEYYALQDSLKMTNKPLHIQSTGSSEEPPITESKPPIDDIDPYVMVGGKSFRQSEWDTLKQIQKDAGTSPTATPDQRLTAYLLSLFRDEKE